MGAEGLGAWAAPQAEEAKEAKVAEEGEREASLVALVGLRAAEGRGLEMEVSLGGGEGRAGGGVKGAEQAAGGWRSRGVVRT